MEGLDSPHIEDTYVIAIGQSSTELNEDAGTMMLTADGPECIRSLG